MKKLTFILAFTAFVFAANAQTLNVQSAAEYLRKGYLNKAKDQIDPACEHEKTKGDAKTWLYKGMIYWEMGRDVNNNAKSKWKSILPTDWAEQAYAAALECKRLDTGNEYADKNNFVFKALAEYYYNQAYKAFEAKDFQKTVELAEQVIQINNNSGDQSLSMDVYNIAALASYNMHNNTLSKKYFNLMIRKKTKEMRPYELLYEIYQAEGDTVNAVKTANSCVKNVKESDKANANFLMARAYLMNGNYEECGKMIEQALVLVKDNPAAYANMLSVAGGVYEKAKDYDKAEAKYRESLTIDADQYAANFGMGSMTFNRGLDKLEAVEAVPLDDESGLSDKLTEEAKDLFRQAIPYLTKSIASLDAVTNEQLKAQNKPNLVNCLRALKTCYARLDMYNESKPIEARIEQLLKEQ